MSFHHLYESLSTPPRIEECAEFDEPRDIWPLRGVLKGIDAEGREH